MTLGNRRPQIGIGKTPELSLRVSVATLTRVVFPSPENGDLMLALEHKATLVPANERVVVKAQPFGGAIQILDLHALQTLIGDFHFDSERSLYERDFRLFIKPADWNVVRAFCLSEFHQAEEPILEADPIRELTEESWDAMGIVLTPDQLIVKPGDTVVENEPVRTENIRAAGSPTVRIYRIFEARILDDTLCQAMLLNSENHSSSTLRRLALENAYKGGLGRANAMLVAPMLIIRKAYLTLSPAARYRAQPFGNTYLDKNVPAILEDITVSQFRRIKTQHGD
jgi:hypothetical protein